MDKEQKKRINKKFAKAGCGALHIGSVVRVQTKHLDKVLRKLKKVKKHIKWLESKNVKIDINVD